MSAFKLVLVVLVIALARVCYLVKLQIYYGLYPSEYPNPYERARKPGSVVESCDNVRFTEVKEYNDVHDFERAVEIVRSGSVPVIFRNYMENVEEKWQKIYETEKNSILQFTDIEIKAFGNAFMPGINVLGLTSSSLEDAVADGNANSSSIFASFVPFVTEESIEYILPGRKKSDFQLDSNFISNFRQDTVSTSFHNAAAVTSYAFQFVGTKMWVFSEPHEYEDFDVFGQPSLIPLNKTEKDFFAKKDPVITVVSRPGDLLVFPPHWAHAVISKAGFNVMVNLREFRLAEAIWTHPIGMLKAFMGAISGKLNAKFDKDADKRQRNILKRGYTHTSSNPYEVKWKAGATFEDKGSFLDSGCKDYFIKKMYE